VIPFETSSKKAAIKLSEKASRPYTASASETFVKTRGELFMQSKIASPKKRTSTLVLALAFAFVAGSFSSTASAQERRRITLDELVIEGNIQKPEAFFILPRTTF